MIGAQACEEPAPRTPIHGPALSQETTKGSASSTLTDSSPVESADDRVRRLVREALEAWDHAGGRRVAQHMSAVLESNRRARDERTPALLLEHREAPGPVLARQVRDIQGRLRALVDELLQSVVDIGQRREQGVMHESSPSWEEGQPLESAEGSLARTLEETADAGPSNGVDEGAAALSACAAAPEDFPPRSAGAAYSVAPGLSFPSSEGTAGAALASQAGGGAAASITAAPGNFPLAPAGQPVSTTAGSPVARGVEGGAGVSSHRAGGGAAAAVGPAAAPVNDNPQGRPID